MLRAACCELRVAGCAMRGPSCGSVVTDTCYLLLVTCHWLSVAMRGETLPTIRQQIIDLLRNQEMDARELSREVSIREKEVYDHLTHIARSLAVKGNKLNIQPARCLSCDYAFEDRQRFTRPGRCPRCKKSHLQSPSYFID